MARNLSVVLLVGISLAVAACHGPRSSGRPDASTRAARVAHAARGTRRLDAGAHPSRMRDRVQDRMRAMTSRQRAPDPRTPAQLAQAACTGPGGKWLCKTPPPKTMRAAVVGATPPSWSVPDWYVDGSKTLPCTSDANTGTSATCGAPGVGPLKTVGQIVARYGTTSPVIAQATTVHFLSDMESGDYWTIVAIPASTYLDSSIDLSCAFEPYFSGTLASYTAKNRTAGTLDQISVTAVDWSTACGGGSCVNADVHDTTANAQFWINADLGSGAATISAPFELPLGFGSPYATLAMGDSVVVGRGANVYLTSTSVFSTFTAIDECTISGDIVNITVNAAASRFNGVRFSPTLVAVVSGTLPYDFPAFFISPAIDSVEGNTSTDAENGIIYGGTVQGVGESFANDTVDADTVINERFHYGGTNNFINVYFGQTNDTDVGPGSVFYFGNTGSPYGGPFVWGPGGFDAYATTVFMYSSATDSILLTGPLTIDGNSTAYSFSSGSYTQQTVTPANVDLYSGLTNPQTGSGFIF